MITFTSNIPARVELYENTTTNPQVNSEADQVVIPATEPLMIRAGQVLDYDDPTQIGSTPDAVFGIYAVHFIADPTGTTTHTIQTDPSATRIVYELDRKRTTTTPPIVVLNSQVQYTCCYVWISKGTNHFPD